jgi:hypothetical protein
MAQFSNARCPHGPKAYPSCAADVKDTRTYADCFTYCEQLDAGCNFEVCSSKHGKHGNYTFVSRAARAAAVL